MAAWRRAIELSLGEADTAKLRSIAQSRTEPASRVERARILLAYREDPSFFAVGRALGLHHQTVQRCVERAVAEGPLAALDDRPRPGREPTITPEAKAWLVSLACRKAKELGYPHELWTTRLLAGHVASMDPRRDMRASPTGPGHSVEDLDQEEVKPHKARDHLEQRDPDFAEKMADAVRYRQVTNPQAGRSRLEEEEQYEKATSSTKKNGMRIAKDADRHQDVVDRGDHRADAEAELEAEGDVDQDDDHRDADGHEGVPLDLLADGGADVVLADLLEAGLRDRPSAAPRAARRTCRRASRS